MKKQSVLHLSNKAKEVIIMRIIYGEKLSSVCKEVNISRTSLYKWLKLKSLSARNPSGKDHWRKIPANKTRRMVNLALKYPDYSIRKISLISGMSVGFVWFTLKKYSLSTNEQRTEHLLSQGVTLYKNIKSADKVVMMDRYLAGESITRICNNFSVSRTIFYKWLNKFINEGNNYETFEKTRPRGNDHWRFIVGLDQYVLAMSATNPELSISKIQDCFNLKHTKNISRSGLYYALKRNDLTTYTRRLAYSKSVRLNVASKEMLEWGRALLLMEFISVFAASFVVSFGLLVFSLNGNMFYKQRSNNVVLPMIIKEEETLAIEEDKIYGEKYQNEKVIYIVKDGDSLWHISEEIFDSGYNWLDIAIINRVKNPDFIEIGQNLIIPIVESKNI